MINPSICHHKYLQYKSHFQEIPRRFFPWHPRLSCSSWIWWRDLSSIGSDPDMDPTDPIQQIPRIHKFHQIDSTKGDLSMSIPAQIEDSRMRDDHFIVISTCFRGDFFLHQPAVPFFCCLLFFKKVPTFVSKFCHVSRPQKKTWLANLKTKQQLHEIFCDDHHISEMKKKPVRKWCPPKKMPPKWFVNSHHWA